MNGAAGPVSGEQMSVKRREPPGDEHETHPPGTTVSSLRRSEPTRTIGVLIYAG